MIDVAKVQIIHTWSDGEETIVTVRAETSFPDALDEARKTAVGAFKEAAAFVCALEAQHAPQQDDPEST